MLIGLFLLLNLVESSEMPPVPSLAPPLNGIKQGTFVFKTIKDRWPKIVTKVIDQVHRYRQTHLSIHPKDGDRDIKAVIGELSEMRYHMATDKPLRAFDDDFEDVTVWNDQLETERKARSDKDLTWYRMDWLFVECYLYRRIVGSFQKTTTLKQFDPFAAQKQNAYIDGLPAMEKIAKYLMQIESDDIKDGDKSATSSQLLQVCLWGNKCDLSLSSGEGVATCTSPIDELQHLTDKILVNQIDEVNEILRNVESKRVDIVLDNAGFELFADMVLADYFVTKLKVEKVVLHGKAHPWFVSDTTNDDFSWITEMLRGSHIEVLNKIGHRWNDLMTNDKFEFRAHPFWTMPFAYCDMRSHAGDLYEDLSKSALIIFKGDLNYRKLVGDRDWPLDTPFKFALRGFAPAPLVALRTLKAETQVGLSAKTIEKLQKEHGTSKDWMVTGDYAVVQFSS